MQADIPVTRNSSYNSYTTQELNVTNDLHEASSSDEENFDMVMGNGEDADAQNSVSNAVAHTLLASNVSNGVTSGFHQNGQSVL